MCVSFLAQNDFCAGDPHTVTGQPSVWRGRDGRTLLRNIGSRAELDAELSE